MYHTSPVRYRYIFQKWSIFIGLKLKKVPDPQHLFLMKFSICILLMWLPVVNGNFAFSLWNSHAIAICRNVSEFIKLFVVGHSWPAGKRGSSDWTWANPTSHTFLVHSGSSHTSPSSTSTQTGGLPDFPLSFYMKKQRSDQWTEVIQRWNSWTAF